MVPNAWSTSWRLDVFVRTDSGSGAPWNISWRRCIWTSWLEAIRFAPGLRHDLRRGSFLHRTSLCTGRQNSDGCDAAVAARNARILWPCHRMDGALLRSYFSTSDRLGLTISAPDCALGQRKKRRRCPNRNGLRLEHNRRTDRFTCRRLWVYTDVLCTWRLENRNRTPFRARHYCRFPPIARATAMATEDHSAFDGGGCSSHAHAYRPDGILASWRDRHRSSHSVPRFGE